MTRTATAPLPRRRLTLLLVLAAFALYANTFSNGYVLDDTAVITGNRIVTKGASAIPEIFSTPYLHGYVDNPNDLYRPLSLVMFAIEWSLGGAAPLLSHVVNVLLFCGCVVMLFLFLDELFVQKRRMMAWLAALLFALHPVHTEVVANIKSRDELLCFFFAFAALLLLLHYARGGARKLLFTGTGCYLLSLLSKETSISFLLIIPAILFLFEKEAARRNRLITGCIASAAMLFLIVRFSVLHAYGADHPFRIAMAENALAAAPSLGVRLATAVLILGKYLKLLFIPYPLVCDYSFNSIPLVGFGDVAVSASLLLYAGIAIIGIRRLKHDRRDPAGLGALLYLVPLGLVSNIFFLIGATMAERFLFFPSAGFCLVVAALFSRWAGDGQASFFRNKKLLLFVAITIVFGGITICRNSDWKDAQTLYLHDAEVAGNNYRLPFYLGTTLMNESNEEADSAARNALQQEAIGWLKKSLAVYPLYPAPYAQIGSAYANLGRYDSAEQYDRHALMFHARDTFTRNNLAAIYFKEGRYREAIAQCRINTETDPGYVRSWSNIGVCYLKLSLPDSGIIALRKALALEPDNMGTHYYLSVAFGMAGMPDSAKKYSVSAGQ